MASDGAAVGRWLPTSRSERRVLVVAGIAAGISAVFRTPLGAALLATEMLYRDDFEADALVPSIFSSVVAYSIVIAIYGETTVFGALPRFPFTPSHVAEIAGSYDLLVPMMLAIGIAYVALRKDSIHPAQVGTRLLSPVHRGRANEAAVLELASRRSARDLLVAPELDAFEENAPLEERRRPRARGGVTADVSRASWGSPARGGATRGGVPDPREVKS
jgi:H+/Cl- antiporter ClcA